MTTDWLVRAGDGENLKRSCKHRIWGIKTINSSGKYFIQNVKPGDRLWFVKNKSDGKLLGVATYCSHNRREFGPLIDISLTNNELGWRGDWKIDIEIYYTDFYGLNGCELLTHIKGAATVRKYNEKCKVNLPVEYSNIVRYSKVTFEL